MRLRHLSIVFPLLAAVPARAEISELRVGVLRHDIGLLTLEREPGWDANIEVLFDPFGAPGMLRPQLGLTVNTSGDTSQAYAGVSWEFDLAAGVFAGFSFGGAIHDGELKGQRYDRARLGSRVLFRESLTLGWRITETQTVSLMFDHVSNANLSETNGGLETLGVRYGVMF